jgi:hypothetical protein
VGVLPVYWRSSVCFPRASTTLEVAVPPVGGVVSVRSPPYATVVRHFSTDCETSAVTVVRPAPS